MKSIKKNRIDHRGEMGSLAKAAGYAMNARPKPAQRRKNKTLENI